MDAHRLAELRSVAYHRALAARIAEDPRILTRARERVRQWLAEGRATFYARRWAELLSGPEDRLREWLVADTEDARALRQSTPFAGELDPRERWRIWREVRERESAQ